MTSEDYQAVFRGSQIFISVVLLGDTGVGKTNIIQNFVKENTALKTQGPTLGVEYSSKLIVISQNRKIKAQIWDTAGQEQYRSVTTDQLKKALGALIVFDITNKKTFESVTSYWMNALKDRAAEDVQIVLVGNKIDRNNERSVSQDEAERYAKKLNIDYRQVYAGDLGHLTKIFTELCEKIANNKRNTNHYDPLTTPMKLNSQNEGGNEGSGRKGCC